MALTGAIYGAKCYPSQFDAVDAFYSHSAPAQTPGLTSYVNEFVKSGASWYQIQYSVSDTGTWTTRSMTLAPVPTFPACDPSEKFLDGVAIGWGIAAAMIVVSALMLARRGVRSG
ncbi:MAG: hypothetical protein PHV02_18560 [Rhodocyclaceae bacterium]|nr:hypothetical protein [Rhodocyclaceae bacterium]